MNLLEYQTKQLFREVGIPILPSQCIEHPKDLKGLKIPYPVVLKVQAHGIREKINSARLVENTIDAIAVAQSLFNLPALGNYPKTLLAEAKYNPDSEVYLAIALHHALRRPVLLGSTQGDGAQATIDSMQQVVVEQEFSPFYARRLALKLGLAGELLNAVSDIVQKMYCLFVQKDLDLVEINPLGIGANGLVMALNGKISVNADAIVRHPELADLLTETNCLAIAGLSESPVAIDGQIGILCNGTGLTLATTDLVCQAGGRPASVINLGSETRWNLSPEMVRDRLAQALEEISQIRQVRVLLINLVSGLLACDEIAEVIAAYLSRRIREPRSITEIRPDPLAQPALRTPQIVVRLVGKNGDLARAQLAEMPVQLATRLDDAVTQTVALAKAVNRRSHSRNEM
jgi:succinyl-CoA synthetase beta subunit